MDENEFLARRFEADRAHLKAVAYRMLGSLSEADDAVQEAWLRLSRSETGDVQNLTGWLTTTVARVCLTMLRTRKTRREDPLDVYVPDPVLSSSAGIDPEYEALLADSVGLALLVVLETLVPAERLAFVLHDLFAVPFEEIGPIVGRSPASARQLASRARRRVRGATPAPDADVAGQRAVVEAFRRAARGGDLAALLQVLDPDVVLRADAGVAGALGSSLVRGAAAVAGQALLFARFADSGRPVLVNGAAGIINIVDGQPMAVLGFTIVDGRIVEIDILADPQRLARLDLTQLGG